MKIINVVLFSIIFTACIIAANGCSGKKKSEKTEVSARPVETAEAIQRDVPVYIDSFGNLCSQNNVDIISQVTGKILEVCFNEGYEVEQGAVLFKIDPSEYKANLSRALAAVSADKVDLKLKEDVLERNRKLFEQKLISPQDFEKYETDVASAEAKIKLDEASVEWQKINLEYCDIKSPIKGITGKRFVDPGNVVIANQGPVLVNVRSIDPLYVDFTIIERDLLRARDKMAVGRKLELEIQAGADKYKGALQSLDNAIDETTGTVSMRAVVSNSDTKLWPGQFVDVRLILDIEKNAVLVPYQAVQVGREGKYVFIITNDNKAQVRNVTIGSRQDDYLVIEEGVEPGELVVVTGQMALGPGMPVVVISKGVDP